MDFDVQRRSPSGSLSWDPKDMDVAQRFAHQIRLELGEFLRAVIFFGSGTHRSEKVDKSDIDIMLIVDDATIVVSPEVISAYRVIVANVAGKISQKLHINTLKLTSFWDGIRVGDPIIINMLRDGVGIYDTGFFGPAQMLLSDGRMHPSVESVYAYEGRSRAALLNAQWRIVQGCVDLYWAVIDAAHAAIMSTGEVSPTPAHIPDLMESKLLETKLVTKAHIDTMRFFYKMYKDIIHKDMRHVTGAEFDQYVSNAKDFVEAMSNVVKSSHPRKDI
ncbi:MAG: hypothetical protein ABIH41_07105 [Nanoarchaeota archaeon]